MTIYIIFLSYMFIYKTFTFFFKLLDVWESAGQGGGFLSSLSPGERSSMFNFFTNFASAVPSQKVKLPPSLHLLLLPLFISSFTSFSSCLGMLPLLGLCFLLWKLFICLFSHLMKIFACKPDGEYLLLQPISL